MQLSLVRHLWGMEGSPASLFPRIKAQGYGAIESAVPPQEEHTQFQELLQQYQFGYIAQIFTSGQNVKEHVQSFLTQVQQAQSLRPLKIVCHSGSDAWSREQSIEFFREVLAIEGDQSIPIAHETHRGRIFFHPTITREIVERFDTLQLCCDFSHWVCVCERLIHDQEETIKLCAARAIHLHARVGYEEGPQVPDPRAPEFASHVEAHERWWHFIWEQQFQKGVEVSTLTPEFGPPGYMHTLPYTQAPVANLEEICDWQAHRQAGLFQKFVSSKEA